MKVGRRWMITDNQTLWPDDRSWPDVVKSAAWQHERGTETAHLHTQAYVTTKAPKTELQLREMFPGAHIELAHSTRVACIKYVTKEDTRVEGPFSYGMELTTPDNRGDGRAPRHFLRLCAFCEKATTAPAIAKKVIDWYVEQELCFPPERRMIDLVTSVMAHNAFNARRPSYEGWRDGWAHHLCQSILYRSEDYLPRGHAVSQRQTPTTSGDRSSSSALPEEEDI